MIGQKVAHYEITEKLGEGGMGVVYKARDTKLDRTVALKFLPAHLSASGDDKARFVQEAKAAATLNHPNICTIHDIQEVDGEIFMVMELVEGQTLREMRASLSVKQALDIGIQLADGLAAAHEKGIVHRDIKPENVMVRKDGICQIMDFGLAKLRNASSRVNRLTREGSTVGTAGYMSPEQVLGQDADHRSDIFSLGVVLYEMLAGQSPFRGVHDTALAYEIVNVDPPPLTAVKPELDPNLDAIVLDCLEKDPKERCQSVAEVGRDLRRVKRESTRQRHSRITAARPVVAPGGQTGPMAPGAPSRAMASGADAPVGSKLPWLVAGAMMLIAAGTLAWHFLAAPPPPGKRVVRAVVLPPAANTFDISVGGHTAISPDGRAIVFVATDTQGVGQLWVRQLASMTPVRLDGTGHARYPFWSGDSRKLGFFSGGRLKTVDAAGGPVLSLSDASDGRGGAWNREGVIVYAPDAGAVLHRIAAAGGTPVPLTSLDTTRHEVSHRWPAFLPDGNTILYTTISSFAGPTDDDVVRVTSLDSTRNKVLSLVSSNVAYAAGRLLFIKQGTLMAQPFDAGTLEFGGDPVPVEESIIFHAPFSKGSFSVSDSGALIFQSGENQVLRTTVFDIKGNPIHTVADVRFGGGIANPGEPRFSPDGKRVSFSVVEPLTRNGDIWISDLARGTNSRLTTTPSLELSPVWTAKGDSIAFRSNREGPFNIYVKSSDGSGEEVPLVRSEIGKIPYHYSPDGRYFSFYTLGNAKTKSDIWIVPLSGNREPISLTATEFGEVAPTFSPDGKWVAFGSDETGRNEIYVLRSDRTGGKIRITRDGARRAHWRNDPRKIYFSSYDRRLQIAYLNAGESTVSVDSIATMFDFESRDIPGNTVSDVSADGKFVAALTTDAKQVAAPISLVINWDQGLQAK